MDLVNLLVLVIVAGLIWYLVTLLPIPEPFATVVKVLVILILILWLLGLVGGVPTFHLRR